MVFICFYHLSCVFRYADIQKEDRTEVQASFITRMVTHPAFDLFFSLVTWPGIVESEDIDVSPPVSSLKIPWNVQQRSQQRLDGSYLCCVDRHTLEFHNDRYTIS